MRAKLKTYYVDGGGWGWYVIQAYNIRQAHKHGTQEFGRGGVREVRLAKPKEVKSYMREKGVTEIEAIES